MTVKEMLAAMLGRLQRGDEAELAEIADALADASAADRLQFLRDVAAQLLYARRNHLDAMFERDPARRELRYEFAVRDTSRASVRHATDALRDRAARSVSDACERGRWYAVRFGTITTHGAAIVPGYEGRQVLRVSAMIAPLDGGRVLDVEAQAAAATGQ